MTSLPSKTETGFCSPSRTRSLGATPLSRSSFSCSLTYCSGFCRVLCTADSDMSWLLCLKGSGLASESWNVELEGRRGGAELHSASSRARRQIKFETLWMDRGPQGPGGKLGWRLPRHPVWIHQNLARESALQFRERLFKLFEPHALAEKRFEVESPRLQQRGHLHPSLVHAPTIDTLHRRALENHVVHQIQRNVFRGNAQQGSPPAGAQRFESLLDCRRVPAHFEQNVHARFIGLAEDSFGRVFRQRIDHHVGAHFLGHAAAMFVGLGRKHNRAPASFCDRDGHQSDRSAPGD